MNQKLLGIALMATAALSLNAKDADPVLMTIDGKDVRLSEFEYLYNKNNSQQVEPVSFDEYVEMFIDYKLKVADARAAGIDTTSTFTKEFTKYTNELALPYLRDEEKAEQLVLDVYNRIGKEAKVSHIMMPPLQQNPRSEEILDSLRTEILNGNITFEDAARKFSVDKGSRERGGYMGWVPGNSRLPWLFEQTAFETPIGTISEPINSGYGFHIVRTEAIREDRGEVNAQHILLMTQGKTQEEAAKQKERIDSIYTVLTTTDADFDLMAKKFSEDPGSGKNGGHLGWFGTGKMVAEFDSVAFALEDGQISKPFATTYGYHIVHTIAHRPNSKPTLEEARPGIEKAISSDSRASLPLRSTIEKRAAATGAKLNENLQSQLFEFISTSGIVSLDSASISMFDNCQVVTYTIGGKDFTVADLVAKYPLRSNLDMNTLPKAMTIQARNTFEREILEQEKEILLAQNPEYRNLVNEYREGILLFEISNINVWERATKDKEGMEQYFLNNRDKYTWDAPRYKAYVVTASNDSILEQARAFSASIDVDLNNPDAVAEAFKKKFGRNAKVERVVAAQGDNAIIDFLGFGGPKPVAEDGQKDKLYFAFDSRLIDAPEEVSDVKGAVISDFQNSLEEAWKADLRKKYPWKINQKVLKKAREK